MWIATIREAKSKLKFNEALKQVLDLLATDLIETTQARVQESGVETVEDVRHQPQRLAGFSPAMAKLNGDLKRFLFARLYSQPTIVEDRDRSVAALDALFSFLPRRSRAHASPVRRTRAAPAAPPRHLRLHRRHDRSFPAPPVPRTPRHLRRLPRPESLHHPSQRQSLRFFAAPSSVNWSLSVWCQRNYLHRRLP